MNISKVTKCIYHKACHDGLASACLVYEINQDIEFIPGQYGDELPAFKNETILIVDFSISEEVLLKLMKYNTIYFVDHHLPSYNLEKHFSSPHFYHVNKDYCGALNLWKLLNNNSDDIPMFIKYINDRDLWENKLPFHKEVFFGLSLEEKTVPNWYNLYVHNKDDISDKIIENGTIIKNKIDSEIKFLASKTYFKELCIDDKQYKVIYVNSPFHQSDLGNYLVKNYDCDFAAIFSFNGENTIFSLRGNDKVDLSYIASKFNGGGHFNAAGCIKYGNHINL